MERDALNEDSDAPAASEPSDVVNAYRALLGRNPESDAVIAANLKRSPGAILGVLAASNEFRSKLRDIAGGLLTSHANLGRDLLEEAWRWAFDRAGLAGDAAGEAPSPARLVAALLRHPAVEARLAEASEETRDAAARILAQPPEALALHRLTRPAVAEDAHHLRLLLLDPESPALAVADRTLHRLIAEAVGRPAFEDAVLRPLATEAPLPCFAMPAAEAQACLDWLRRRLGAETGESPCLGGMIAALLTLPAVDALLQRSWPAEHARTMGALPALASGAHQLAAQHATGEDIHLAYLAVLGRPPESSLARRAQEGNSLRGLLSTLLASAEFRAHVLSRLSGTGAAIPHLGLGGEQRRAVSRWIDTRIGQPAAAGAPAPLHAMALVARLLSLPVLAAELARQHGALWTAARDALAAWMAEGRHGLLGAIDYVTGDWIAGWAIDRAGTAPLEIEVHCDGRLVALGRADRPRPGLDAEEDLGGRDCGFRLAWRGRDGSAGAALPTGPMRRFQIVAARSGEPVGPAFELDSLFVEPRTTLQALTLELRQARATIERIERLLPQLESFAAFPVAEHASFRRTHRILPPPPPGIASGPAPALRVLVSGDGVSVRGLRRTVEALRRQEGVAWEARLLTTTPEQAAFAAGVAARDRRVAATAVEDAAGCHDTALMLLRAMPVDRPVLLLPPGMMPGTPHALAWFAEAMRRFPASAGICCDEDVAFEEPGDLPDRHADPVLRAAPDGWSLASGNDAGSALCARAGALADALAAAGDIPGTDDRAWIAWAALARTGAITHIPRLLLSRQAGEGPEAVSAAEASTAEAVRAALAPLLPHPWLLAGAASPEDSDAGIAVIVPTRNGGPLLAACLASLREKATAPDRLSILVIDNGSDMPETLAILEAEAAQPGTQVLRLPEPFNWARLNNLAARGATAEHLLFLNDDTRMLSGGWDRALRRLLALPEVGAVGARLVYEDLTIQHGGVLFGIEGLAAHEGVGAAMEDGGPGGRWQRLRRVGAVTGAFLACRRTAFETAGGFDEHAFGVTFNDVDVCLRLRAAGLAVLYAPEIALVHYESKSRGIDSLDAAKQERAEFERRLLVERWGAGVLVDPGYNPHWSRWSRPFTAIREPSEAEILAHMAATASADPWNPVPR